MSRAYYSKEVKQFLFEDNSFILGKLASNHQFSLDEQQRNSWINQIQILKENLSTLNRGHILFEYTIPRMGKRVDVILIMDGIIFLMEFKVGETVYTRAAKDQVLDYALDLKNFHEESHKAVIVPIVVATEAQKEEFSIRSYEDKIYQPLLANKNNVNEVLQSFKSKCDNNTIDPIQWEDSIYKPTPTIIEAAQALYNGHNVSEISRSDSGAINLSKTTEAIHSIIERSKREKLKSICFVTGVPGAGKTLAGLNIANQHHQSDYGEHAVFLSGNGPLNVLQEALARDESSNDPKVTKSTALQKAKAFIQNIHHFRDDALYVDEPPAEKVAIFDEAQRAWTLEQTSLFMKKKKGYLDFNMSEPQFLISIMDRHEEWSVIVCLIGGGQEINTGEAGLTEWFEALKIQFKHWQIFISNELHDQEYTRDSTLSEMLDGLAYTSIPDLHLQTSMRSFRSEKVSQLIRAILDLRKGSARELYLQIKDKYPIMITRDVEKAKQWVKQNARGSERYGILASSGATRLKPYGIFIQHQIEAKNWFLNSKADIRSSYYLEDTATEFDVQGLELDWTCVAWDADLRLTEEGWEYKKFRGSKWENVINTNSIQYLVNAYRVLLTRARQGMIIFVPRGNSLDETRLPEYYDHIYRYLSSIGFDQL